MLNNFGTRIAVIVGCALIGLVPAKAETAKDCTAKVLSAFEKQRQLKGFTMKTTMLDSGGATTMTVSYQLPDRMRQVVKRVLEPDASETVLVGNKAWTRRGGKWNEVPSAYVEQLKQHVNETVISPAKDESYYACLGTETIDGKELIKTRGFETIRTAGNAKDGQPGNNVKLKLDKREGAPVRLVYLDAKSGLPARNTVATSNRPDQPFFRGQFLYPEAVEIKPPSVGVVGSD